jgi:D-alanyl-D-alanine dipeptidase
MKKILFTMMLFIGSSLPVLAETISYDKTDFAEISSVIDDAVYDIRYYSSNNFTGNKIQGYKAPRAYMTKQALAALAQAAQDLRNQRYSFYYPLFSWHNNLCFFNIIYKLQLSSCDLLST